jgi:hypothetical protein
VQLAGSKRDAKPMSDERKLTPQDADYFQAIGLAVVAFARAEWNAVWCCERLRPGYINSIEPKRKTAGDIAGDLTKLFTRIVDSQLRLKAVPFAEEFRLLALERNGLLHGKPGSNDAKQQRLFRHGDEWTIAKVNAFSDRCVLAGRPLNALLYNELEEPCVVRLHVASSGS